MSKNIRNLYLILFPSLIFFCNNWALSQNAIEKTYAEAYNYFAKNDYKSAINFYKKGIQLSVYQKDTTNILFGYSNIYGALLTQNKQEQFLLFLPILKKYFYCKNVFLMNIHCNLAGSYQKLADLNNSEEQLNAAINVSKKISIKDDEYYYQLGICFNQNATHKTILGDYSMAKQMHQQAIENYKKIVNKDEFVWNEIYNEYSNLSRLNYNQGSFKEAQKYLKLSKPIINSNEFIKIINYNMLLAQLYLKNALNKPDSSVFYLNQVKGLYKKFKLEQLGGRSLYTMALVAYEANDFKNAENYLGKSLELRLKQQNTLVIADCYKVYGQIKLKQNNPINALEQFQIAFKYLSTNFKSENLNDNPKLEDLKYKNDALEIFKEKISALLIIYKKEGKKEFLNYALNTIKTVHELINYQRNSFQLEGSKLFLSEQAHAIYGLAIEAAFEKYKLTHDEQFINLAFAYSEANKAVVLFESIKAQNANSFVGVPQELLNQEITAVKNIAIYENQLYKDAKNEDQWRKKLIEVTDELAILKAKFKKDYAQYYNFKYNTETITANEIQTKIADNQSVIEYFVHENRLFTFLITKTKIKLFQQILPENFNQSVINYKNLILGKSIGAEYKNLSNILYKTLFNAEILSIFEKDKINNLKIIGDGVINYIPMEALLTKPVKTLKETDIYLIERYIIGYLPSATMNWKNTKPKESKWFPDTYIGFAPSYKKGLNLPDNQANVSNLAIEFSGESVLYKDANIQNFNEYSSKNSKILHLSMHGGASEINEMESFLAFENDSLFVHDIYTKNIPTDLAILDACETGMGILNNGEGILSLARAFLHAGSQAVAMSLWKLSSSAETAQIVSDFANLVIDSTPKDIALSQAKLNYLTKNRQDLNLSHPFYWAPLIIVGNAEPIEPNYYKYWLVLFVLLIAYSYSSYRNH